MRKLLALATLSIYAILTWALASARVTGVAPTTVQDGIAAVPGTRSLFYYRNVGTGGPGEIWYSSNHIVDGLAGAESTLFTNSNLKAVPFYSTRGGVIDKLAFQLTTKPSGAGRCVIAVYDNGGSDTVLYPVNRVAYCTADLNINAAATPPEVFACGAATSGANTCTTCSTSGCTLCTPTTLTTAAGAGTSLTLTPNSLYWLALNCNTSNGGVRALSPLNTPAVFMDTGLAAANSVIVASSSYNAIPPATYPAGGTINMLTSVILLAVHFAS